MIGLPGALGSYANLSILRSAPQGGCPDHTGGSLLSSTAQDDPTEPGSVKHGPTILPFLWPTPLHQGGPGKRRLPLTLNPAVGSLPPPAIRLSPLPRGLAPTQELGARRTQSSWGAPNSPWHPPNRGRTEPNLRWEAAPRAPGLGGFASRGSRARRSQAPGGPGVQGSFPAPQNARGLAGRRLLQLLPRRPKSAGRSQAPRAPCSRRAGRPRGSPPLPGPACLLPSFFN